MLRRELAIAIRNRGVWLCAAICGLLVGHGLILAVDLYSASSRSALANALQAREMDPLAGIVRPTLGGLDLSIALLGPIVVARVLSVEKERNTFRALCLEVGSIHRVVTAKLVGGLVAASLLMVAAVTALLGFRAVGGRFDPIETGVAFGGEFLRILLVTAVSIAAAAWTRTVAQATTVGILVSLSSWAIDAADGFAALAWLGVAEPWSIERKLAPFQRGVLGLGPIAWLLGAVAGAIGLSLVGARFDWSIRRRVTLAAIVAICTFAVMSMSATWRRGYDWTECRRASLPPAAVDGLRHLEAPLRLEVFLDRDDSRRQMLESDTLAKLVLARPDAEIVWPLDAGTVIGGDAQYGRIVVHVGASIRETRSTSRRELIALVFEAAGKLLPDWSQSPYPGYPIVIDGSRRRVLGIWAYGLVPLSFVLCGFVLTKRRIGR